jgi:acetyl coenzyme A synthetase (ADP forming)-like protein
MLKAHPIQPGLEFQESPLSGGLYLRDGSVASVRPARSGDVEAMVTFFQTISLESRWMRFLGTSLPERVRVQRWCDPDHPNDRLTLLALRLVSGQSRIVAVATYERIDSEEAEVAFCVDDHYQGRGVGMALLERLCAAAALNGILRFRAICSPENCPMMEVFRNSGFPMAVTAESGQLNITVQLQMDEAGATRVALRERMNTVASLRPMLSPRSVAIIGASRSEDAIGHRIVKFMQKAQYKGHIYPVNPKAGEICSLKSYANLREIPEPVDLAVIAVPRSKVLEVAKDCADAGVRALAVISAGFAETDESGRQLQAQLLDLVRTSGMRMIGPNCLGLINANANVRLNASFSPIYPVPGRIAMSSQSGALGMGVLGLTRKLGLGISTFVSIGNKADVTSNDLLQYWEQDANTNLILLYLESFGNPRRFSRIARRVSRSKPIVCVKSGRSEAGRRAAGSHTAALSSADAATDGLFEQTGVIRADSLSEMFDLAIFLESQPLPAGRRVGIVTNAGGPGILCADACEGRGLVVGPLSPQTPDRLNGLVNSQASLSNPIDLLAGAGPNTYHAALRALLADDTIDATVVIHVPVNIADLADVRLAIANAVAAARTAGCTKPVLACIMGEDGATGPIAAGAECIPVYPYPEVAGAVLARASGYSEWRRQPVGTYLEFEDVDRETAVRVCEKVRAKHPAEERVWLDPDQVRVVLASFGIKVPPAITARNKEEAVVAAREVGYPVAVKLVSATVVHKSDVGGVQLGITSDDGVREAYDTISRALKAHDLDGVMEGVLIQKMVGPGTELMAGVVQDRLFGPLVAFGLGGIHVEVLKDVTFRVTPLTDRDASRMLRSIHGARLLDGYRGHPPADQTALEELLLRLSSLVEHLPEIHQIDLNPIVAMAPGCGYAILDARIQISTKRDGVGFGGSCAEK